MVNPDSTVNDVSWTTYEDEEPLFRIEELDNVSISLVEFDVSSISVEFKIEDTEDDNIVPSSNSKIFSPVIPFKSTFPPVGVATKVSNDRDDLLEQAWELFFNSEVLEYLMNSYFEFPSKEFQKKLLAKNIAYVWFF